VVCSFTFLPLRFFVALVVLTLGVIGSVFAAPQPIQRTPWEIMGNLVPSVVWTSENHGKSWEISTEITVNDG
jgi:hypothetical protein